VTREGEEKDDMEKHSENQREGGCRGPVIIDMQGGRDQSLTTSFLVVAGGQVPQQ
jgi:hypothetical protein